MLAATLRQNARECAARAKGLLDQQNSASLRHAALELRMAIEYIAYQVLASYLAETPDEVMEKWTPRDVISQMLEVDPHADKSSSIRLVREGKSEGDLGETALAEEDRRFSLRWAHKNHNALGNFLHAPTLLQMKSEGGSNEDKIRAKLDEICVTINHILSAGVFNANFGSFLTFQCECGREIKRRSGSFSAEKPLVCPNAECKAIWDAQQTEDKEWVFKKHRAEYTCVSCGSNREVPYHILAPGLNILCKCGAKTKVEWAIIPIKE